MMPGKESVFRSINETFIGGSHEKTGKVCQDYSWSFSCRDCALGVVADGHGADRYVRSDKGSKLATEVTCGVIKEYYNANALSDISEDPNSVLHNLVCTIIARWNAAISEDYQNNPLTSSEIEKIGAVDCIVPEKCYGTTLAAGFISREFAFGIQIGDGAFVIHHGDKTEMPMSEDPNCVGNRTSSLCDADALSKFRIWFTTDIPDAIMVSTDGLYTTFPTDSDFRSYCGRMIDYCIRNKVRWDLVSVNLKKRAHAGHEDDLSVALIGLSNN